MNRETDRRALVLAVVALGCWLLLFGAGTDVWHDIGRPDIVGRLSGHGATVFDIRAAAYAFYGLFFVLSVQVIVTGFAVVRRR